MRIWRILPAALVALALASGAGRAAPPDFGAAGVPRSIGATRDYDRIFITLRSAGIGLFLATFQYQEAPVAKSLGHETDFLPPCSAGAPAFAALRRHGIRLVLPGDLLYPAEAALPPLAADPLRALIACAGRGGVYGVLSYDEPAHRDIPAAAAQRLYRRVKAVDPTLPVLMVHAPIVMDQDRHRTAAGRDAYLAEVLRHSAHADIVGFDLYPIPEALAQIATPASGGRIVDYRTAVRDYVGWLKRRLPAKRHLLVLQGFSYRDQFEPAFLRQVADAAALSAVRPPTAQELRDMVAIGAQAGVAVIFWWGQSFVANEEAPPWPGLLSVTDAASGLP